MIWIILYAIIHLVCASVDFGAGRARHKVVYSSLYEDNPNSFFYDDAFGCFIGGPIWLILEALESNWFKYGFDYRWIKNEIS